LQSFKVYFLTELSIFEDFSRGSSEGTLSLLENKLVEGETTIYVCQFKVCKLPVTDTKAALTQIFNQQM